MKVGEMLPTLNPAPWRRITSLSPSIVSKIYRETVAQRKLFGQNHTSIFLKKRSSSFSNIEGEEWKENSLKNLGGEKKKTKTLNTNSFFPLSSVPLFAIPLAWVSYLPFLTQENEPNICQISLLR